MLLEIISAVIANFSAVGRRPDYVFSDHWNRVDGRHARSVLPHASRMAFELAGSLPLYRFLFCLAFLAQIRQGSSRLLHRRRMVPRQTT